MLSYLLALATPHLATASPLLQAITSRATQNEAGAVSNTIYSTLRNPSDTLSILLVIGGDVILKALAQLAGPTIVPVAFSFGWVAYSFNTLMSVFGDGRLMAPPDYPAKVFNIASGIPRDNRSWVLGRFLRDIEQPLENGIGMNLFVYRIKDLNDARPMLDWCYYSGIVTIVIQLGVAAIPCGLLGDYSTLLITACGTILALLAGSLPQWNLEKYPGRRRKRKVVAITGGNGSRNVVLIIDPGYGIDLEDLAAAQPPMLRYTRSQDRSILGMPISLRITQVSCVVLATMWILLLIIVTGLDLNLWYLLLVGGLGMLQNVVVAGAKRKPGASGIHLEKVEEIKRTKVSQVLMDTEAVYPNAGRILLREFFSDPLPPADMEYWEQKRPSKTIDERDSIVMDDNANAELVKQARKDYNTIIFGVESEEKS